ncbi:MAG: Tad domain-containing protein [Chloroflexi bacterium]|nr:Tad domain-containing protein [Chloroflexota bacterium]
MMPHRSTAQALVWLTIALPLFLSIAGLAIDGGVLLASRRQLQSVADGAARAGATRLDLDRLRSSGGAEVQLDQTLARVAAATYLDERLARELAWPASPHTYVQVGVRRVHVLVQGNLPTAFLRVVHIDSVAVEASAFADVQYGIGAGGAG